jgi:hypothetical protein
MKSFILRAQAGSPILSKGVRMVDLRVRSAPMFAELLLYCWIGACVAAALWLGARLYANLFENLASFAKWSGRRIRFYFAWFSFLHQRRKTERFIALANRLWRRDKASQIADRNILPRS